MSEPAAVPEETLSFVPCRFRQADAFREVGGPRDGIRVVAIGLEARAGDGSPANLDFALAPEDAAHLVYQVIIALADLGDPFAHLMARHIRDDGILPLREGGRDGGIGAVGR